MADPSTATNDAHARLADLAAALVHQYGPAFHQLLSDLNKNRLGGHGRLGSAEIGRQHVRWTLEWQADEIAYKMNVVIGLRDDGSSTFIDRVMVHKEATTSSTFEGHTPTTLMKMLKNLDVEEIRKTIIEFWPT
jgi:hypothetical protein